MKQLSEFDTLQAARDYEFNQGKLIHKNTMNALLADGGWFLRLRDIEENPLHPLRDKVAAFRDSSEFNFMESHPMGQKVIAMMNALIEHEGDEDLELIRDSAIAMANTRTKPYGNVSEYEWRKARGEEINTKQVTPVNGYIKITLTQDVEAHRPQVFADVQGVERRVTSFGIVDKAGDYIAEVPRSYTIFYVDDAYGAM